MTVEKKNGKMIEAAKPFIKMKKVLILTLRMSNFERSLFYGGQINAVSIN